MILLFCFCFVFLSVPKIYLYYIVKFQYNDLGYWTDTQTNTANQWLQFEFSGNRYVTGVRTRGRAVSVQYVQEYQIQYWSTGVWNTVKNPDQTDKVCIYMLYLCVNYKHNMNVSIFLVILYKLY